MRDKYSITGELVQIGGIDPTIVIRLAKDNYFIINTTRDGVMRIPMERMYKTVTVLYELDLNGEAHYELISWK